MKLFEHQQEAINHARENNLALFHDCGTGKTCTALNIIKHHKTKGYGPTLVVCPLSIIDAAWISWFSVAADVFSYEKFLITHWKPIILPEQALKSEVK